MYLTNAQKELMGARQTTLSDMWQRDFFASNITWMNTEWGSALAEKLVDSKRWRYMQLGYYNQATMYVHRIMSYNEGFPMEIGRMSSYYSGIFDSMIDDVDYYILFEDPYYGKWILFVFREIDLNEYYPSVVVEVYEVLHGEDAIMVLSSEDTDDEETD